MSNQTSGFRPKRRIAWQKGIQPPGSTGVPNQSSSFPKRAGLSIVREVDGSPSIEDVEILEVSNDTLSEPGPNIARIDTGGSGSSVETREVTLIFSALVAAGTPIDVQTGVYGGAGSPASREADLNVTLPASGAAFKDDGRIMIKLNGQELLKGDGSGNGVAEWVSTTQIKLSLKIKNKGCVLVRAPFPTA